MTARASLGARRQVARRGKAGPGASPSNGAADAGAKQYDRAYFDRWYRRSRVGVGEREFVERKVRLAVAAAEFVLARTIRSVLDVGCGEAPWRAILRRLRPKIDYLGFDSSEYVVARYGRRRNIRRASLGELGSMGLRGKFDLVVCADVLHYVRSAEARAGLATLAPLVGGVAFLEAFTSADAIDGDHAELQKRTPAAYRRLFAEVGLVPIGLHLYVTRATAGTLVALERGAAG
jgi:SAM-dependent methyltransferase